jgi:uncharacterized LabA/DUF88 family protein
VNYGIPPTRNQSPISSKRIMLFVDGGYLRKQMEDNLKNRYFIEDKEKPKFETNLQTIFGKACERFMVDTRADLIRIYYYDGESDDQKHEQIRLYQDKLRSMSDVQVKTIELVKSSKQGEYKQKGIDTLIAVDMLSKALRTITMLRIF